MDRFWSKVNKTEDCWLWQGAVGSHGYGNYYDGSKYWTAHRYSFYLSGGDISKMVLHSCDVKACVNPNHLRSGTAHDNSQDTLLRGQATTGEKSYWAKFTERQVLKIRELYATGRYTQNELAKRYGVRQSTIFKLVHRQRWGHI